VDEENMEEKVSYYRPQLAAYSAALEKILGKPVKRRVLYFFRTGQAVDV
jgi:ATP-dependent helicase/nuclease subunit A